MRIEPFAHAPSILPGESSGPVEGARQALLVDLLRWRPRRSAHAAEANRKLDAAGIGANLDTGSNVWVVSGAKSASGRPMVASDPHCASVAVDVLRARDPRQGPRPAYGVTFPGLPVDRPRH